MARRYCPDILALGLCVGIAQGREYEIATPPPSEDEVYERYADGDISAETADVFLQLLQYPLDLNRASADDLYALPGVTRDQAEAIVAGRATGPYTQVADIQPVAGLAPEMWQRLRPYITVASAPLRLPTELTLLSVLRVEDGAVVAGPRGYMRARTRRGDYAEAGAVVTYRDHVSAGYDPAQGALIASAAQDQARLETVYASLHGRQWSAIAGNFTAGFGAGLTFNNTVARAADGWYRPASARVSLDAASVDPPRGLFGLALTRTAASWQITGFISHRNREIYQYDLRYGPDPWHALYDAGCDRAGTEQDGYTCGEDGRWYATRLLDAASAQNMTYMTLDDAYRETLAGGDITVRAGAARVGLTAYAARIDFALAAPEARFAPAARNPDRPRFGALGLHVAQRLAACDLAAEYTRTHAGGNGYYARCLRRFRGQGELELAARWYDADFDNPHARAESAPDEVEGAAARNERGVRAQWLHTPGRWRTVSMIELWDHPYMQIDGVWLRDEGAALWTSLAQRVGLALNGTDALSLAAAYRNAYDTGAAADEKVKLEVEASTQRLEPLRLAAMAAHAQLVKSGDRDTHGRLRVEVRPWHGGVVGLTLAWRAGALYQDQVGREITFGWEQVLPNSLTAQLLLHYHNGIDRGDYVAARFALTSEFGG